MPLGFTASNARTICCFRPRSSNTASITRSTDSKPDQSRVAVSSRIFSARSILSMERRFTRPSRMWRTAPSARPAAASSFSRTRTGTPAFTVT